MRAQPHASLICRSVWQQSSALFDELTQRNYRIVTDGRYNDKILAEVMKERLLLKCDTRHRPVEGARTVNTIALRGVMIR